MKGPSSAAPASAELGCSHADNELHQLYSGAGVSGKRAVRPRSALPEGRATVGHLGTAHHGLRPIRSNNERCEVQAFFLIPCCVIRRLIHCSASTFIVQLQVKYMA